MANSIKDSLLYKTLFTPEMDFTGADVAGSQGEQRLRTLAQRIKKMDQCDRSELKADLNHILTNAQLPNPTPLKERGVCVLLLTDFGTHAQTHNIIDSFFRWIRNTFGDRVSTQSLIDTILAVHAANTTQPRANLNLDQMKATLEAQQAALQQERATGLPEQKMNDLLVLKDLCADAHTSIAATLDAMQANPVTEADTDAYLCNIETEVHKIIRAFAERNLTNTFVDLINDLTRTTFYATRTESENLKGLKDDKDYLTQEELDLVEQMTGLLITKPPTIEIKRNITKLVHNSILGKLKALQSRLEVVHEEKREENNQSQNKINLLRNRAALLTDGQLVFELNQAIAEREASLNTELNNIRAFGSNISLIDTWIRALAVLKDKEKHGSRAISKNIDRCLDELRKNHNPNDAFFVNHLAFLYGIASGENKYATDEGAIEKFTNYLQPFGADSPDERDLKNTLSTGYNIDPTGLDGAAKLSYVENYLKCLSFALSKKCAEHADRKEALKAQIQSLKVERRKVLRRENAQNLQLGVEFVPPSSVPSLADAGLTAQLMGYAEQVRASDMKLQEVCERLETRPEIRDRVYQNFYFIMKREGKIKEGHGNWGGLVFAGKELNRLLQTTFVAELQTFRAQALQLAAQGVTITSENDPIFSP